MALNLSVSQLLPSVHRRTCCSPQIQEGFSPGALDCHGFYSIKSGSGSLKNSLAVRAISQREALESRSTIVTDDNVPEGHKGLHGFLYGDDGADVHGTGSKEFLLTDGEDDGLSIVVLDDYLKSREGLKLAGIYAVYNSNSALQYVGYSRNVILSLKSHRNRVGREKCFSVRVKVFTDLAMVTRTRLEEERLNWLDESEIPPGNSIEKDLWEITSGGANLNHMPESEKIQYEEKKLKMRKAMGENLHDEVDGEEDDARTRRLKLLQATEGDDWSGVIDGQTKDTLNKAIRASSKPEQAVAAIISPFENSASVKSEAPQDSSGLYSADRFDLTMENVDMVLNDVRPYLVADGGNVEVVSLDNGVVSLRLQGACGTCPSSTVTMKMGIERVLKEKFGESLKEIVQVDQQQIGATVMAVNAHLDILRPAIHNYGGFVDVTAVEGGECKVKFKGPPPVGMGIQAAIKDKFPDVTSVVLVDA